MRLLFTCRKGGHLIGLDQKREKELSICIAPVTSPGHRPQGKRCAINRLLADIAALTLRMHWFQRIQFSTTSAFLSYLPNAPSFRPERSVLGSGRIYLAWLYRYGQPLFLQPSRWRA